MGGEHPEQESRVLSLRQRARLERRIVEVATEFWGRALGAPAAVVETSPSVEAVSAASASISISRFNRQTTPASPATSSVSGTTSDPATAAPRSRATFTG